MGIGRDLSQCLDWADQWRGAATGPDGFWQTRKPVDHFVTSASTSGLTARMVAQLLEQRPWIRSVIDIGAGDGDLLAGLAELTPDRTLIGVDIRPAPRPDLRWCDGVWETETGHWRGSAATVLATLREPTMIIAAEWLDELPCSVVQDGPANPQPAPAPERRWHRLRVDRTGREALGAAVADDDANGSAELDWLRRWWDVPPAGSARAEIGITRDQAWTTLIMALAGVGGAALMIDYGHLRSSRPPAGSLTGYAEGRRWPPVPDGRMNLTADVAVDSVADAGLRAGAQTSFLISQAEAVRRLLRDPCPDRSDPLAALQGRGERHALASRLGGHWWLLQEIGAD